MMNNLVEWVIDDIFRLAVVLIGGVVVGVYFLAATVNQMTLPGELARITALRAVVATVQPNEAEDVAGQVAAVNQDIASNKAYNATWYGALLIPNAWDTVTALTVPSVRPEAR